MSGNSGGWGPLVLGAGCGLVLIAGLLLWIVVRLWRTALNPRYAEDQRSAVWILFSSNLGGLSYWLLAAWLNLSHSGLIAWLPGLALLLLSAGVPALLMRRWPKTSLPHRAGWANAAMALLIAGLGYVDVGIGVLLVLLLLVVNASLKHSVLARWLMGPCPEMEPRSPVVTD